MTGRTARVLVSAGTGAFALALAAAAPAAAGERGYELVSPAGSISSIRSDAGLPKASTADGNVVCFRTPDPLVDADPLGGTRIDDLYCARRGASGWATEWISRPHGRVVLGETAMGGAGLSYLSPDGTKQAFRTDVVISDELPTPEQPDHPVDGYLRANGTTTLITGPRAAGEGRQAAIVAASDDLTHLVYLDAERQAWEWVNGTKRMASVGADGSPAQFISGLPALNLEATTTQLAQQAVPGTISANGSRIFFHSRGQLVPGQGSASVVSVWVRENGTTTRLVSPRRGPDGTTAQQIEFWGASADGDVVFLRTLEQLTPEPKAAGFAVYSYRLSNDELKLIASNAAAPASSGVLRVLGHSRDGSTVVLYGQNVVAPTDGASIYVARGGTVTRLVGVQSSERGTGPVVASTVLGRRPLRISDDGRTVVFQAIGDTPGTSGVYRWRDGAGLEVVSKDASGTKVAAELGNFGHEEAVTARMSGGRTMSDDGDVVFFTTAAPLVPQDVNGTTDVYEWRNGVIGLVSPGTAPSDAHYYDSSADGSSVFFTTDERVTPAFDTNNASDLYVARPGGGFPPPAPSPIGSPAGGGGPAGPAPVTPPSTVEPVPVPAPQPQSPDGGSTEPEAEKPEGLTLSVRARGDAGNRFRLRGRLQTTLTAACAGGEVRLRIVRRGNVLADETVALRSSCRYRGSLTVARSDMPRRGRLKVKARFLGNDRLLPIGTTTRERVGGGARR